jgi:hypothetical protein
MPFGRPGQAVVPISPSVPLLRLKNPIEIGFTFMIRHLRRQGEEGRHRSDAAGYGESEFMPTIRPDDPGGRYGIDA